VNCRKVTHLLSAYMDGELPGVEHRQIHEHLARCADCNADYQDLLQMKRLLGRMRMHTAYNDMPTQILHKIHSEDGNGFSTRTPSWIDIILLMMRRKLTSPQTLSFGLGVAAVAALYISQLNVSSSHTNDFAYVKWQESPLTVHEFMNGIHYADSERFITRPIRASYPAVTSKEPFSVDDPTLFQRRPFTVQFEQLVYRQR
jgi:hypothetical protein